MEGFSTVPRPTTTPTERPTAPGAAPGGLAWAVASARTGDAWNQHAPAFVAMRMVGDEGPRWRPRPVELAVVTDDGRELSTLVNPRRDMGDSVLSLGISASDVRFAPLLPEAWRVFAGMVGGRVPVGLGIVEGLSRLDFEMRRWGVALEWPVGWDPSVCLTSEEQLELRCASALEEARGLRELAGSSATLRRGLALAPRLTDPFPELSWEAPVVLLPREGRRRRFVVTGLDGDDELGRSIILAEHLRRACLASVVTWRTPTP